MKSTFLSLSVTVRAVRSSQVCRLELNFMRYNAEFLQHGAPVMLSPHLYPVM